MSSSVSAMSSNQDWTGTCRGARRGGEGQPEPHREAGLRSSKGYGLSLLCSAVARGAHRVLRVEDVGGRRVVQDERLVQVPAQTAQVLDVAALVEDAGLPEEPRAEHPALVQKVRHRVGVLARARERPVVESGLCRHVGEAARFPAIPRSRAPAGSGLASSEDPPTARPAAQRTSPNHVPSAWQRGEHPPPPVSLTLARLAVKRTHSNSSPIRLRNSSTKGLLST